MARRLGVVQVLTASTVQLDRGGVGNVVLAHGEQRLSLAHDAGTLAKVCLFELLKLYCVSSVPSLFHRISYHFGQTPGRHNVPRMYQAIQVPCRLFNGFPHVIVAVEVEYICDEVERVLVVLNFGVQTSQVEAVGEVVFVDFAKVFIASGGDELVKIFISSVP